MAATRDSLDDRASSSWSRETSENTSPTEKLSLDLNFHDPETQPLRDKHKAFSAHEYSIPTRTKYLYLSLYFGLNLTLTLFNKAVLGQFNFPWLLTTLHTGSASLGCLVLMLRGQFSLTRLTTRENLTLVAFSFLFTVNIAVSNVSLSMVSVPFHQTMRSTCPVFAILIYRFLYSRSYSTSTYISLVPIILGVALATYGDYYFTTIGFFLTLLGVLLASAKTVASNRLMTGSLALPPLEILLRMSPLAALQSLLFAILSGEGNAFLAWVHEGNLSPRYAVALASNGYLAFLLNITSFYTNKLAGALTITVCANMKQCLTILLGVIAFNVHVGMLNGCGMVIALLGAAVYSKVELDSKGKKNESPPPALAYVPFMRKVSRDLELVTLSPKEAVFE